MGEGVVRRKAWRERMMRGSYVSGREWSVVLEAMEEKTRCDMSLAVVG